MFFYKEILFALFICAHLYQHRADNKTILICAGPLIIIRAGHQREPGFLFMLHDRLVIWRNDSIGQHFKYILLPEGMDKDLIAGLEHVV